MRTKIWAAFVFLTFIWGASFLWIKIAVLDVGPYTLVAFRLAFGLLGLVAIAIYKKPGWPRDRATWNAVFVLGIFSAVVPWILISWAEETIDSALAGVLNSTVPLFTLLIAHFALRDDRITVARIIGLLLGFVGVVVLSQRDGGESAASAEGARANLLGQGAMLLAALSYAISGVFARRKLRHVSALFQALYSMLTATILMWVMLPFLETSIRLPSDATTWFGLVWLGVLGAGVAALAFYFLLHAIGPTRASMVTYTIPVVGVALGVIVLNERLDWYLILGAALIVMGLWVVERRRGLPHTSEGGS